MPLLSTSIVRWHVRLSTKCRDILPFYHFSITKVQVSAESTG